MKNSIIKILLYLWAGIMIVIVATAIIQILISTPYAWVGALVVIVVLILTRNVELFPLYKKQPRK